MDAPALIDRDIFAAFAEGEATYWWFAARRAILRRLVDAVVPVRPGRTVLDIGCGVGSTLTAFHPDFACVGYDPSPDAVEFARKRHPQFDLHAGSADAATARVSHADVVLLNDVIEHVPDDRALLHGVVAAMKPGAVLVVTVPADMRLWSPHDERMGHYRRYDLPLLAHAVAGMPLETLLASPFMARLYPIVRAVRMVSQRRGKAAGVSGIDMRVPPAPVNALLRRIFAGESARLLAVLAGRARPYTHGVSLVALYRRT